MYTATEYELLRFIRTTEQLELGRKVTFSSISDLTQNLLQSNCDDGDCESVVRFEI